jgi:hypothetical protein
LSHPGLHKTLQGPEQKSAQCHQGEKNEKLRAKERQAVDQSVPALACFRFPGIHRPYALFAGRLAIVIGRIVIQFS